MNPNLRIQRYLIAIESIGTRFAGAQQQPDCLTVVGALEGQLEVQLTKLTIRCNMFHVIMKYMVLGETAGNSLS
ncbi:unnamed protein product [Cuscuta campestris]|uniref:Uncharacterized protein n=1 Tax=Cuscuta campestris TaxID=132261 RepID=A0A484N8V2_9ASTE|nr:unnamed protein product [Cuscuta campestris]